MIEHLQKVGDSHALILGDAILELLGLEENGEVELTISNGSLIMTPISPRAIDQERFEECVERVFAERREVLQRLALPQDGDRLRTDIQVGLDELDRGERIDGDTVFAELRAQAEELAKRAP